MLQLCQRKNKHISPEPRFAFLESWIADRAACLSFHLAVILEHGLQTLLEKKGPAKRLTVIGIRAGPPFSNN